MNWLAVVYVCVKLAVLFFSTWREREKVRKEIKKQAMKDIKDGLKERNPAKITSAFDSVNRL